MDTTPSLPGRCSPARHAALKADPDRFRAETRFIGLQTGRGMPALSLVNCSCGSTLSRRVPAPKVVRLRRTLRTDAGPRPCLVECRIEGDEVIPLSAHGLDVSPIFGAEVFARLGRGDVMPFIEAALKAAA